MTALETIKIRTAAILSALETLEEIAELIRLLTTRIKNSPDELTLVTDMSMVKCLTTYITDEHMLQTDVKDDIHKIMCVIIDDMVNKEGSTCH